MFAKAELIAFLDTFSQISILDVSGTLICMFFVYREQLAAWMPDGTRFGPSSMIRGPETPDARLKIGRALLAATELGRKRCS